MKLIQEIGPFFTLKVHIKVVFEQKSPPYTLIPPSMFSDFALFAPPPRLFQPPGLLER